MLKKNSFLQFVKLLLMMLVVSIFSFGHIWIRTRVVTTGYEVEKKRVELQKLKEKNNALSVKKDQVMSVESLLKLRKEASYRDLREFRPEQFLVFESAEQDE